MHFHFSFTYCWQSFPSQQPIQFGKSHVQEKYQGSGGGGDLSFLLSAQNLRLIQLGLSIFLQKSLWLTQSPAEIWLLKQWKTFTGYAQNMLPTKLLLDQKPVAWFHSPRTGVLRTFHLWGKYFTRGFVSEIKIFKRITKWKLGLFCQRGKYDTVINKHFIILVSSKAYNLPPKYKEIDFYSLLELFPNNRTRKSRKHACFQACY